MSAAHRERLSGVDTAWLRMDSDVNSMVIVSVTVTETPVSAAAFRRLLEERFLRFPRFRQRPVADALGAAWVDDTNFDLDAHLRVVELPTPGGRTDLEALTAALASTTLDRERPLWQVHLVSRYGGGSAWIMRIHHCYADGIAMIRVLLSMTEARAAARDALPAARRRAGGRSRARAELPLIDWIGQISPPAGEALETALTEGARLIEIGLKQALHPEHAATLARQAGGMVRELARVIALPDDPRTPYRAALSGRKAVAWADPLPLEDVKSVGRALECTVNDVLMSTVSGALGARLRDQGFDTHGLKIRATVPVNLRGSEQELSLGNRFGLIFVEMPLGLRNPLRRLYAMHSTMAALKGSMQPPMTLAVLGLLGMLPAAVQAPAIELFSRKGTAVVSNVPGPKTPLYLCGQRITEMYFWVPQSGSMGIGVSVLTYAGRVHVGMIADRNLVPDPQRVVDLFAPELEKLRASVNAGALGAQREKEKKGKAAKRREGVRTRRTATKTHESTRKEGRKVKEKKTMGGRTD
jgi:diacylglycerol O-acyltransferase / wax synthase